jgi:hypothetical protein
MTHIWETRIKNSQRLKDYANKPRRRLRAAVRGGGA